MPTARAASLLFVIAACGTAGCTALETYPASISERCDNHVDDDFDDLVDFDDPDCAVFGAACIPGDGTCERATLVCAARGSAHACSPTCGPDRACPAGWTCTADACACTPCVERCNGSDDDCDGRIDESTCAVGEICADGTCSCPAPGHELVVPGTLDLLFVMDDSPSMVDRLITLHDALGAAMTELSTGDLDGDGTRDVAPVSSLHVAVVTTDLGIGGSVSVSGCSERGDDGLLSHGTRCPGMPVFYFETYRDSPDALARALPCALDFPSPGCGFSQPIEAALLALSTAEPTAGTRMGYVAPTFHDGTHGQGDSPTNELFLRPESSLAVVFVTDSDDCSATDVGLYSPSDERYQATSYAHRCTDYPDALQSVTAAVDHFFALRRVPQHVIFAAIAGIPSGAGDMRPADILALPAMQIALDPNDPRRVLPACTYLTHGGVTLPSVRAGADPARRIVEAAQDIQCQGGSYALASVCDDDYDAAFRDILRAVASADDRRVCVHDSP